MAQKCNICNAICSDSENHCPNCGQSFSSQKKSQENFVFCSKCGQRNIEGHNYCFNCANPLNTKLPSKVSPEISINKIILKIILIFGSIIGIIMCISKIVDLNVLRDEADFDASWSLIEEYEDKINWYELEDEEEEHDLRIVSEKLVDAIEEEIYRYWLVLFLCGVPLIIGFKISHKVTENKDNNSYLNDLYLEK